MCPKDGKKRKYPSSFVVPITLGHAWAITCIHLIEGRPASEWKRIDVDDGREVDADWVCTSCFGKHMQGRDSVDDLRPVCIYCMRHMKTLAGVKEGHDEYE